LGTGERRVLSTLAALEHPTVSATNVVEHLGLSRQAANLALARLAHKGWLRRVRRGVYTLVPISADTGDASGEDPRALAMRLFAPCYISGWTAAQHWELTEQIFNVVAVYSAKHERRATQQLGGVTYRIRRVPPEAIFGTTNLWAGTVAIAMATVHRTLIDVLDAPEMGGGARQTLDMVKAYWQRSDANPEELLSLATRLGRGSVFKRLGFTAERFGRPEPSWVTRCRELLSAGVTLLDPQGPPRGPIISRWRLRINVPLDQEL